MVMVVVRGLVGLRWGISIENGMSNICHCISDTYWVKNAAFWIQPLTQQNQATTITIYFNLQFQRIDSCYITTWTVAMKNVTSAKIDYYNKTCFTAYRFQFSLIVSEHAGAKMSTDLKLLAYVAHEEMFGCIWILVSDLWAESARFILPTTQYVTILNEF